MVAPSISMGSYGNICQGHGPLCLHQLELDEVALELNMRPQTRFDFKCHIEMMSILMAHYHVATASTH